MPTVHMQLVFRNIYEGQSMVIHCRFPFPSFPPDTVKQSNLSIIHRVVFRVVLL